MSRKTKRQKVIAEARRIIEQSKKSTLTPVSSTQSPPTVGLKVNSYNLPVKEPALRNNQDLQNQPEFKAVKKDILKTVFLAIIAVFAEFIVYLKIRG